jgi:predicted RNA-binding Zn-ribbon protein involved in translation (DUF1610 family)
MDYIDTKFINYLSVKLSKFKKVKPDLYNFRCPICGDSLKNKNKARGYFYAVKNNTNYKCHNCGVNISFNNFLKKIDPFLYKQYSFEKFQEGKTGKNFVVEAPKFNIKKPTFKQKIDLPKSSEIDFVKEYLTSRNLNPDKFYFAEKFKTWTNTIIHKFDDIKYDEPRIIIPLYQDKSLIGFQGRSLDDKNDCKYITIMLDEAYPKIYGLDEINTNETIYILEGPFDSTFVKNSIAMCGADVDIRSFNWRDIVYIYDNEPRNKEILSRIESHIDNGEKVVIWPSNIEEKDVNLMINSGLDVETVIKSNTYAGLEAKLKFTNWKKI